MPTVRTRSAKGSALSGTEYDNAVLLPSVAKASNYNVLAEHNRELHELADGITATLPTASGSLTETDDFYITFKAIGATGATIDTNSQSVDGSSADIILEQYESVTIAMNAAQDGFVKVAGHIDATTSDTADTLVKRDSNGRFSQFYGATAYRSTDLTIPNGVYTNVTFDAEAIDSGSVFTPTSELFVAPSWATKMRMTGIIRFTGHNTGIASARVVRSTNVQTTPSYTINVINSASIYCNLIIATGILPIVSGASYKIQVFQSSGGDLDIPGATNATHITVEFFP